MSIINESVEEIERGNLVAHLLPDRDAENPLENMTRVGQILGGHRRYSYEDIAGPGSDELHERYPDATSFEEALEKYVRDEHDATHVLPLYMLDHSGIAFRTTSFNDPWDSGLYGVVFATKKSVAETLGEDATDEQVLDALRIEIGELNSYVQGDVYGIVVVEKGTEHELASCWGFVGREYAEGDAAKEMLDEAEAVLAAEREANEREAAERTFWAERDVLTVAA